MIRVGLMRDFLGILGVRVLELGDLGDGGCGEEEGEGEEEEEEEE